jgi:hypothetical protein
LVRGNLNSKKKLGMVVQVYHPSSIRKLNIEGTQRRPAWAKFEPLSPKQPEQKGLVVWLK